MSSLSLSVNKYFYENIVISLFNQKKKISCGPKMKSGFKYSGFPLMIENHMMNITEYSNKFILKKRKSYFEKEKKYYYLLMN